MDFEKYIYNVEPDKKEKAAAWQTAIGLQAVDGLKTSEYLKDTARKHIEGEISIDEVKSLIKGYYQAKKVRTPDDNETEEADKVSANIAQILNEQSFSYSITGLTSIHRRLFEGIFKFAGKIRTYDITKKEWVLRGDTVLYVNSEDIKRAIEYDLDEEKNFSYKGLSAEETIEHIAKFVSNLWQIHPFAEGNTRTTAVFTIKYLRSIGFNVNNDLFANQSWYFRNALVRANYRNVRKGIEPNINFLVLFFRNLLMEEEENELKNRCMIVNPTLEVIEEPKPQIYNRTFKMNKLSPKITKALKFSVEAHSGQLDKAGEIYFLHPITVAITLAKNGYSDESIVTALLHDVIEDTSYTIEDIKKMGFEESIITALKFLTHNDNIDYLEYIKQIKTNSIAREVKIADLLHNMDTSRLKTITEKDKMRLNKYVQAIEMLK